jgi:thiamine biosynthesis lipoprotein
MTDKKPTNVKDILTTLKNKDNLIILLEIIVIAIAVVALVFVLVGRNNSNGTNDGGGDKEGGGNNDEIVKTQYSNSSFSYFDTFTKIIGAEATQEEFAEVSGKALQLLGEYHKLFDIYNEYDGIVNICTLNKVVDGEHRELTVDQKIIDMLTYAKEMYRKTDGKMNIAMGSVLSIWHDYRTQGLEDFNNASLPPMSELLAAAEHVNIDDIIIDDENNTVFLADPKMRLDVGAFAKGYAVEMVARMLEDMGKTGYTVNVGGNIRTIGTKYTGDKWKAGIENPVDTTTYVEYISLSGEAVVTSGSYQRYYIVNGKSYHHIIDIDTLMPADKGFYSVSVICSDSGLGDGLSTALFCMTLEEGMALVNSLDGVEAMWVMTNESKHYSNGFDKYITK